MGASFGNPRVGFGAIEHLLNGSAKEERQRLPPASVPARPLMDAAESSLCQGVTYVHVLETHSYWIHKDGEYLPQASREFSQRMLPKPPEAKELTVSTSS
ncbi:hypothetical protein ASPCAL03444 [Aspergillus calidoustus]|uniref:Uncharacterized protein n=1 Tax=Aspergillus calidoustus TaxID=454130 RepID=A0A0U5FRW7_ASPCI|nr:hypothetical protein ASPCAL03444 [Aspergillus calidoustus]